MTTKKFNETKLGAELVTKFVERLNAQLLAEDAQMFFCRLVECGIRFLAKFKSKGNRVAVVFKTLDPNNEFLFGLATDYIAPEEGASEEMPGSWGIVASLKEEDIDNSQVVYDLQNAVFCSEMVALMSKFAGVKLSRPDLFAQIAETVFYTLKSHLEATASKSTDEYGIDFDTFKINCKKEADGSFSYEVLLDGDLKRIIKDDTALEQINMNC